MSHFVWPCLRVSCYRMISFSRLSTFVFSLDYAPCSGSKYMHSQGKSCSKANLRFRLEIHGDSTACFHFVFFWVPEHSGSGPSGVLHGSNMMHFMVLKGINAPLQWGKYHHTCRWRWHAPARRLIEETCRETNANRGRKGGGSKHVSAHNNNSLEYCACERTSHSSTGHCFESMGWRSALARKWIGRYRRYVRVSQCQRFALHNKALEATGHTWHAAFASPHLESASYIVAANCVPLPSRTRDVKPKQVMFQVWRSLWSRRKSHRAEHCTCQTVLYKPFKPNYTFLQGPRSPG